MSYSHDKRKKNIKKREYVGYNEIINPTTGELCEHQMVKGVWKLVPINK